MKMLLLGPNGQLDKELAPYFETDTPNPINIYGASKLAGEYAIQSIKNSEAWEQEIYHLVPQGISNWHEIAQILVTFAEQLHVPLITSACDTQSITTAEYPIVARRPLNSQLDTHKLRAKISFDLPHWKADFLTIINEMIKGLNII